MPCYHPLHGWQVPGGPWRKQGHIGASPLTVPCGSCIGCRIERSRQWALRCVHEAQQHEDNCFLTLTYAPKYLPEGGTLVKKHFQDFMKRLRHHAEKKIQYFHCGEYGEKDRRPHYHALIFGWDFSDKSLYKTTGRGDAVFISPTLERLWGWGFTTLGSVSFESAAYCARYVLKKISGEKAAAHYRNTDPETGEQHDILPEYVTMSLKPAIGKGWYTEFSADVYPSDFLIMQGKKMKPPRYYDKQLPAEQLAALKCERRAFAEAHEADSTRPRLDVREAVLQSKLKILKREL